MSQRILVADDDAVTRLIASEALRHAGFSTVMVSDGRAAYERCRTDHLDAMLLDMQMPNMDGLQCCELVRKLPGGATLPILVMTSNDDAQSIEQAYLAGATDFITKPLNTRLLGHRVRYMLRASDAFIEVRQTAWRLAQAHRLAKLAQWERAPDGTLTWSEEAAILFGGTPDLLRYVHPEDRPMVNEALASGQPHAIEYRLLRANNEERIVHQEAELTFDQSSSVPRLIGAIQDVTERRHAERRVTELAFFDGLTGLPNRTYLRRYLARAVADAERFGQTLAVLALDLDLFKRVNDMFGHSAGDALLSEVAMRLLASTRAGDLTSRMPVGHLDDLPDSETLAARLGGDEFVVVLRRLRSPEEAGIVAQRILDRIGQRFVLDGNEVLVSTSIGIATYPDNGRDVDTLIKNADTALYSAKDSGRSNYQFFNRAIQVRARRRAEIENGLRLALSRVEADGGMGHEHNEFALHFQPKVSIPDRRVVGFEALARWNSPTLGWVSPVEFIPAAEDTGLVVPLGAWVLWRACELSASWDSSSKDGLSVGVNISPRQFREPGFVDLVARVLEKTGLPAHRLEIEITESVVMQDTGLSERVIAALKELGVLIALDDFGTGYSSLSYLTRFPIDILKIDRSFVTGLDGPRNHAIVSAIMALSKSLSLKVVAEGIETESQLTSFSQFGELDVQGFYFARPMDAVTWQRWYRDFPTER